MHTKPDVEVIKKEDESYLVEAARGEAQATAKATPYSSGLTQLIVTADAGMRTSDGRYLERSKIYKITGYEYFLPAVTVPERLHGLKGHLDGEDKLIFANLPLTIRRHHAGSRHLRSENLA